MRAVVVVIAALMTLGLAAFGVVAAQNAAGPSSILAFAARIISPTQSSSTPVPAVAMQPAPVRVAQNPVAQISDATTTSLPAPSPAAPVLVAQNTASALPATAPAANPAPGAA